MAPAPDPGRRPGAGLLDQAQLALAGQRWHRERLHQFVGSPFPSADELQAMDWGTPLLLALLPWVVALLGLGVRRWRRRRAA